MQTTLNVEETNSAKAVHKSQCNNNYLTDNPVAHSPAMQMRKEQMKKFDIGFKTKLRLEHARFERRKLEQNKKNRSLKQIINYWKRSVSWRARSREKH